MRSVLDYRRAQKPTPRQRVVAVAVGFFGTLILLGIGSVVLAVLVLLEIIPPS